MNSVERVHTALKLGISAALLLMMWNIFGVC